MTWIVPLKETFHFLHVEVCHNRRPCGSYGTAMLLCVVTFVAFEVGGGQAEVQQITNQFSSEVCSKAQSTVLYESFESDSFHFFGPWYTCEEKDDIIGDSGFLWCQPEVPNFTAKFIKLWKWCVVLLTRGKSIVIQCFVML